jgi:hypothetical protein
MTISDYPLERGGEYSLVHFTDHLYFQYDTCIALSDTRDKHQIYQEEE